MRNVCAVIDLDISERVRVCKVCERATKLCGDFHRGQTRSHREKANEILYSTEFEDALERVPKTSENLRFPRSAMVQCSHNKMHTC
jgi:hypothetical protein